MFYRDVPVDTWISRFPFINFIEDESKCRCGLRLSRSDYRPWESRQHVGVSQKCPICQSETTFMASKDPRERMRHAQMVNMFWDPADGMGQPKLRLVKKKSPRPSADSRRNSDCLKES